MKPKPSPRNPFTIAAKKRKAGKILSRLRRRRSGKNKQREMLKEVE